MQAVVTGSETTTKASHPIKATLGESLLEGFSRSYAGFWLRDNKRVIEVNQAIVKQKIDYLVAFAVIACFVEVRPLHHKMKEWLSTLQEKVCDRLILERNLGKSFFYY